MAVTWFGSERGKGGRTASVKPIGIAFTMKPKGVRFNAPLAKELQAKNVERVMVGYEGTNFIIKPTTSETDGFKIVYGKGSSAQICASAVRVFADQNLKVFNYTGKYDEQNDQYIFDLKDGLKNEVAATGE